MAPPPSGPKPPPGVKLVPTQLPEQEEQSGPKIKLQFSGPKRKDLPPEPAKAAAKPDPKGKGKAAAAATGAPAAKQISPLIIFGAFAAIIIVLLGGMFVLLLLKPVPEVPVAAPVAPAPVATPAAAAPAEDIVLTGSTAAAVETPELEIPSTPEAFVASLSPVLLQVESGTALVVDDVIYPANTIIEPELGVRFAGIRESTGEAIFQDANGNTHSRKF